MSKGKLDERKVRRGEVLIVLGGMDHLVKVLPIVQADAWLARADAAISAYEGQRPADVELNEEEEAQEVSERARARAFARQLLDVIVAYAPELPWSELRGTVTADELLSAFDALMEATDPFVIKEREAKQKEMEEMDRVLRHFQNASPETVDKLMAFAIQKQLG